MLIIILIIFFNLIPHSSQDVENILLKSNDKERRLKENDGLITALQSQLSNYKSYEEQQQLLEKESQDTIAKLRFDFIIFVYDF